MATAPKKKSAVNVVRDRNTSAMPACQLGYSRFLFEADEYEGQRSLKAPVHYNAQGIEALKAFLQTKCIDAHFAKMVEECKEMGIPCVTDIDGCMSPADWLEMKLKDPHEKDKVQLPKLQLKVSADRPVKGGGTEPRTIVFWDRAGKIIPHEKLKRMASGTWVEPVVHANLFASKQVGKAPQPNLMLVGFNILKLVEFGRTEQAPSHTDDDELRRIMGDDYSAADDIAALVGGADEQGVDGDDPF